MSTVLLLVSVCFVNCEEQSFFVQFDSDWESGSLYDFCLLYFLSCLFALFFFSLAVTVFIENSFTGNC